MMHGTVIFWWSVRGVGHRLLRYNASHVSYVQEELGFFFPHPSLSFLLLLEYILVKIRGRLEYIKGGAHLQL
jgi:hypothetical protein